MEWDKLTSDEVAAVAAAIASRTDQIKTTWKDVCDETQAALGKSYTRQSLEKHDKIKKAYADRVQANRKYRATGQKERVHHSDAKDRRIAKLEAELEAARAVINNYDARFYLILQNTSRLGFRREELERLLPATRPGEKPANI